ncbi:uncharacterized protein B0I36DRAFT_373954 [Microdochium trichocladiopsis]|uniref:Cation-transporting P-type ATPase N-terminal domain-containing protein n=1 Tax=Microdochium trichocladiopsis TaxID=1682393 RepID=A0A9P8Y6T8_9PEZI|nr:uncharacterized protein B0I36DRAFT_373954 [Microdochium trichocladiopsis]KAH7030773.1 hypothetical protein B0I36DRAFT_373954 [Microdochium trichocladiopsis]
MDDVDLEKSQSRPAGGIRWDEENRRSLSQRPNALRRTRSNSSMSIRSVRSRREVDPAVALPIQYRTVSFGIEQTKAKDEAPLAKAKDATTAELSSLEWHTITTDEALRRLSSTPNQGLSDDQVARKFKEFGKNAPSPPKSRRLQKYIGYMTTGFSPILVLGAVLVFISWKPLGEPNPAVANLALAIVLVGVWLINVAFQTWQDWSSSKVMSSIKNMLPEDTLVIRNGTQISLGAPELVPGDIVCVKAGNKLPADLRFLQVSTDAKFDRSILTGESLPLAATIDSTDQNYLETRNIGLQGTHCVSGNCLGLVVSTGDRTVFGRIANLTNTPQTGLTTLEKEVLHFVIMICTLMFAMVAIVLICWGAWLRKDHPDWISIPVLIVSCVSVAIAFIPEGLPIAVTSGLTITANIMRKNKVLCKSLKTVETLGSVSVICSDKTGTLTQNRMTVTECNIGNKALAAADAAKDLQESTDTSGSGVSQLRILSALCNGAEFDAASMSKPIEERLVHGDATDQAIIRFSEGLGSVSQVRQCWQKTYELAFNSKNKFMIRSFSMFRRDVLGQTLSEVEASSWQGNDTLLTIKGAPDVLIGRCGYYTTSSGETKPFDADIRASFENQKNLWSSQGKRCILLARKIVRQSSIKNHTGTSGFEDEMNEHSKSGLTLVGLVAIVDPLRPEIREVVETLRGAGIRIFMVTGDFALTALAIAQDAGIVRTPTPLVDDVTALPREAPTDSSSDSESHKCVRTSLVISGPELITLNEHQWKALTQYEEIVFARTTPEQKLRIVNEFQASSGIVAMTGDGVNDAPSLKAADVGIAMASGSDIAIEAADMVLLESFSSIVEAVKYGRVVFDNLKKVICYLLPAGSFAEFWPVMTSVLFGLPQILSSFLMIIICCFTDCAAATVLSYEQPEADVLLRKPRNVKTDRLVNWQLGIHAYGFVGVFMTFTSFAMSYWYLERRGIPFSVLWLSYGVLPDSIDQDYYNQCLYEASSVYFINLVVMQWFNLMAIRTRKWSIFQHPPLFNPKTQNWYLFPAIGFAIVMAILWLYIPQLQDTLGLAPAPVEYWFLPMAYGAFLLISDETRKYFIRSRPNGFLAKMAW